MTKQSPNSLNERILDHKSLSYSIATGLRENGYGIASCSGMRQTEPDSDYIGILKYQEPLQKSFLGIKWRERQRALYLGILWLNNQARNAREDKKWILEVYGKENIPKLTEIVKEFSELKKVRVQVRLAKEQPKMEAFLQDFDPFDYPIF